MDTPSRREFITASALGMAAVPTLLSTARAQTAPPPSEKIRLGLIGCGGISQADLPCFLQHKEVDCPVICDVDPSHLAERARMVEELRGKAPETVSDFRRIIDRQDIDMVLVCTPDHWHALPTIMACEAGKDVYVEKPLGKTIDEGRAMLEAAKANSRVVQMGTQWRSGEHYRAAVECVQSGRIGKVRMVRAWAYLDWLGGVGNPPDGDPPAGVGYDMWLGPAAKRPFNPNRFHFNFRWFWDYAGGLMTDWGVHLLNVCLWAMGPEPPLRVSSMGGKMVLDDNSETPDTQVTVYEFPKYTLVFEHQIQGGIGPGGQPHGMLFSGTEGTVIVNEGGWELIPEPKKKGLEAVKAPAGKDARPAHIANFLECLRTREKPVENLEVGHYVSSIAHLGNLAFNSGAEVHWDVEKEAVIGNAKADALVGCEYRAPWKLTHGRRC